MKRTAFVLATFVLTTLCFAQDEDWELEDWSMETLVSNTKGFSLSPHLNGASMELEGSEARPNEGGGGGFGIEAGYGVSNLVTLFLNLDGTNVNPERGNNYALGHADLGVLFNFLKPDKPVRPFLGVALTGRNATFRSGTAETTASGPALTARGGVRYFVSPSVSLDGDISVSAGTFTSVEFSIPGAETTAEVDIDATTARIKLGISWFVGR